MNKESIPQDWPDSIAEAARQILDTGELYDAKPDSPIGIVEVDMARGKVAMLGATICYQALLDLAGGKDDALASKVLDACHIALRAGLARFCHSGMELRFPPPPVRKSL